MNLDEVTTLTLRMFELESELDGVKRRLRDAVQRAAAKKNVRVRRNRIPAKDQIISALKAAPKRTLTVSELVGKSTRVSKSTLLWTLSRMSKEKRSGVVRLDYGVYQLRQ